MYTVTIKNEGEVQVEKPHDSVRIRHINGDAQIRKSILYSARKPEIFTLVKDKDMVFDDLESGTTFNFESTTPFTVVCELE
jgi:arginine repressor